jgi:beta-glucanase (GH16 family)
MTELKLLWSEEFNAGSGLRPDSKTWNNQNGDGTEFGIPGWGNQEREFYIPAAATMDGESNLLIHAQRIEDQPDRPDTYYGKAEWTSARLATNDKVTFKYGRIEARVKVPTGVGSWPAVWMLGTDIHDNPWPACGEIDIIEARGCAPREVIGTVHGPGYCADNGRGTSIWLEADLSDDFHVFAIEWLPSGITWYLDGEKYFSTSPEDIAPLEWVFDHEFYLLINLAIGGGFAGPIEDSLMEADFVLDYIRHYSIDGVGEVKLFNQ